MTKISFLLEVDRFPLFSRAIPLSDRSPLFFLFALIFSPSAPLSALSSPPALLQALFFGKFFYCTLQYDFVALYSTILLIGSLNFLAKEPWVF